MKRIILIILLTFYINANAQYSTLFDFAGTGNSGGYPYGSLYYDGTYLYGMTSSFGANVSINGNGNIFKIKPDGTGYFDLHDFGSTATDGNSPHGNLIFDGTYLYGMTLVGGSNNTCGGGCGTIFKIKPDGSGYTIILDFTNAAIGGQPYGSLIFDGTFFYGMTNGGGANNMGTIFKIKPDGTGYLNLHDFGNGIDGDMPMGDLCLNGQFLYGMTPAGGAYNNGNLFKIKNDGTLYAVLHDFGDTGTDGTAPQGSLICDGIYLYGMTANGGTGTGPSCNSAGGCGTIFKIKIDGTGYDTLMSFNGINGASPTGSLYLNGTTLYGMSSNAAGIFKINTNATGFTDLYDFGTNITDGGSPFGSLISDGTCLYGMTFGGPSSTGYGTIFKLCNFINVEQHSNINEFGNIYPNPTVGKFNIKTSLHEKQNVQIFDMNGECLLNQITFGNAEVDASNFDNGVYTVTIKGDSGITNRKLIISK